MPVTFRCPSCGHSLAGEVVLQSGRMKACRFGFCDWIGRHDDERAWVKVADLPNHPEPPVLTHYWRKEAVGRWSLINIHGFTFAYIEKLKRGAQAFVLKHDVYVGQPISPDVWSASREALRALDLQQIGRSQDERPHR